jgi:hypothetical protein
MHTYVDAGTRGATDIARKKVRQEILEALVAEDWNPAP